MIDFGPPPLVFPKPAIVRKAEGELLQKPSVMERLRYGGEPCAAMVLAINNLTGFGAGTTEVGPIEVTDDGDSANTAGGGTTTLTFGSQSSTGPHTLVLLSWKDGGLPTLSSATFGGNSMDILVQKRGGSGDETGVAILYVSGAQSGDIVAVFSETTDDAYITVLSLRNLQSGTPVDIDSAEDFDSSISLSALNAPGEGGVRVALVAHRSEGSATSWINLANETADINVGSFQWRHVNGYDTDNVSDTITASWSGGDAAAICGVSLR